MKKFLKLLVVTSVLLYPPIAIAAENWVEVTVNSVGDRILIDRNSIQQNNNEVRYWEYQDKRQSRNASTDVVGDQPVYGMMIYRTVDCVSGSSSMQRLVLFNQNREVIRRINYEASGGISQPMAGSSTETVIQYVCGLQ